MPEYGGIAVHAAEEHRATRPPSREIDRLVEPHVTGRERLGQHVDLTVDLEDQRIREVKRLSQRDAAVAPRAPVRALAPGDFAPAGMIVPHFKEQVPASAM